MLILTRKKDQRIILRTRDEGEVIAEIMICGIEHRGARVKVGISADEESVQIVRAELLEPWPKVRSGRKKLDIDAPIPSCVHKPNEEHMVCRVCGQCKDSLNEHDTCSECTVESYQVVSLCR